MEARAELDPRAGEGPRSPHCKAAAQARDVMRVGLIGFGLYHVVLGAFQAVAPGPFFEALGPFGSRNDHYTRDLATFSLALGALLLAAVRLRSWRVPALALAFLQWGLHALNHLLDIGEASPRWVGVVDFAGLAAGAMILGLLLARAVRAERWARSDGDLNTGGG